MTDCEEPEKEDFEPPFDFRQRVRAPLISAVEHIAKSSPNQIAQRVFNVVGESYQKRGLVELARRYFPRVEIAVTDKDPGKSMPSESLGAL